MAAHVMKNWKIAPTKGGGVCLVGEVDGKQRQTSDITKGLPGAVMTESGTIYHIDPKDAVVGVWEMQLQISRPEKYANLQKCGVL